MPAKCDFPAVGGCGVARRNDFALTIQDTGTSSVRVVSRSVCTRSIALRARPQHSPKPNTAVDSLHRARSTGVRIPRRARQQRARDWISSLIGFGPALFVESAQPFRSHARHTQWLTGCAHILPKEVEPAVANDTSAQWQAEFMTAPAKSPQPSAGARTCQRHGARAARARGGERSGPKAVCCAE
jgi:hypothetical protein